MKLSVKMPKGISKRTKTLWRVSKNQESTPTEKPPLFMFFLTGYVIWPASSPGIPAIACLMVIYPLLANTAEQAQVPRQSFKR
ncbi:MAG: hypothetical protein AB7E76_06540 [Deferribacterales bacterium]